MQTSYVASIIRSTEARSEQATQKANYQRRTFPCELFQVLLSKVQVLSWCWPPYLLLKAEEAKTGDVSILQFPVQSQAHYNVNHY